MMCSTVLTKNNDNSPITQSTSNFALALHYQQQISEVL